jgi:hypothetical protein
MRHTYGEEDGVPCLVLLVEGLAWVEADGMYMYMYRIYRRC